jgi:hypothetical protein
MNVEMTEVEMLAWLVIRKEMDAAFAFLDKMKEISPTKIPMKIDRITELVNRRTFVSRQLDGCFCDDVHGDGITCADCRRYYLEYATLETQIIEETKKQWIARMTAPVTHVKG